MHGLHEGITRPGALSWAAALERQKGALLVTELRNNSCKIAKWVYGSMLAGADTMKIGFISPRNNKQHVLAVQTSRTLDLASQMGLKVSNAWGFVREIFDMILSDMVEDGQYIITRDALSSQIKVHYNPVDEDDEENNIREDAEEDDE